MRGSLNTLVAVVVLCAFGVVTVHGMDCGMRAQRRLAVLARHLCPAQEQVAVVSECVAGKYTQTEAAMHVPIEEHEKSLGFSPVKYMSFLEKIVGVEREHENCLLLYHGRTMKNALLGDLYQEIKILQGVQFPDGYVALRANSDLHDQYAPEYLREHVSAFGLDGKRERDIDNYVGDHQKNLLSTNVAAYGRFGNGSSSLYYFAKNHNEKTPDNVVDRFLLDCDEQFLTRCEGRLRQFVSLALAAIARQIDCKEGEMVQMLIPHNIADLYTYPCIPLGRVRGEKIALSDGRVIEEGYDHHLQCYTKVTPIMHMLQNNAEFMQEYVKDAEARVIMHKDFLDPKTGIRFVRHSLLSADQKEYVKSEIQKLAQFVHDCMKGMITEAQFGRYYIEYIRCLLHTGRTIMDSEGERIAVVTYLWLLLERGHDCAYYDDAWEIIMAYCVDASFTVRMITLKIVEFLLERGYAPEKIFPVLIKSKKAPNLGVLNTCMLEYCGKLQQKAQVAWALQWKDGNLAHMLAKAELYMQGDYLAKQAAFLLYSVLVDKKYCIEKIEAAVQCGMQDRDAGVKHSAHGVDRKLRSLKFKKYNKQYFVEHGLDLLARL